MLFKICYVIALLALGNPNCSYGLHAITVVCFDEPYDILKIKNALAKYLQAVMSRSAAFEFTLTGTK
jgi:hypothetical protein